jgi:hypothetical protein
MPPETNYSADSRDSFFVKHPITLAVVLACAIFGGVGAWFYYTNRPIPEDQSGVTQTQESPPHQPTQAEIVQSLSASVSTSTLKSTPAPKVIKSLSSPSKTTTTTRTPQITKENQAIIDSMSSAK